MPPVLGWAAMRGEVGPEACVMFLIIFLWTPPHFWALSLFVKTDYANAGVPMLPVVAGVTTTRRHILLYTLPMVAAAIALAIQPRGLKQVMAAHLSEQNNRPELAREALSAAAFFLPKRIRKRLRVIGR